MRPLLWALPALAIVPILSGCASLSAKGKAPELPPMNVPPAPERVIEPAPEPLPEPVADLPSAPPTSSSVARNNTRPPVSRPVPQAETKPADPKPVEQPPPQDPAPVPQPPVAPTAQLRTPQTADTNNAEKNIRATLARAAGLLSNVDYRNLSNERKKAYNDANGFIREAEEKLKEGNFVFAQFVANKAETLAKELAGK